MVKFNVVLTSNGFINSSVRSKEQDKLFEQIAKNKKVLLVVNATKTGSNVIAKYDVKVNFEKVGASIVDLIEIDSSNVENIYKYDVIYGMGGDITPLLEDARKCDFRKYLIKFLENGIYIGESAGSIVLAEDVKWYYDVKRGTKPKYDVILDSYKGLNIIDKMICPHYNALSDEIKEKINKYEKNNNIDITCLNDGEFILVIVQ